MVLLKWVALGVSQVGHWAKTHLDKAIPEPSVLVAVVRPSKLTQTGDIKGAPPPATWYPHGLKIVATF